MKLAKFYAKYFLFRSTRKMENIEKVIHSHGFDIFEFDPHAPSSPILRACRCEEYARTHPCFIYVNKNIKDIFIQENLSVEDRIEYLFHEEAHIWYNHPNTISFTDNTNAQQEKVANFFLFRLRVLKATSTLLSALLIAGLIFFILHPSKNVDVPAAPNQSVTTPQANTGPIPAELEEVEKAADKIKTVYITAHGDCYHQKACDQIAASDTITPITITMAEQLGKRPCITCCY